MDPDQQNEKLQTVEEAESPQKLQRTGRRAGENWKKDEVHELPPK